MNLLSNGPTANAVQLWGTTWCNSGIPMLNKEGETECNYTKKMVSTALVKAY